MSRSLLSTRAGVLLVFVDADFVGDGGRLEGSLRLGAEPRSGGTRTSTGCSSGTVISVSSARGSAVAASGAIPLFSLSLEPAVETLRCDQPLVTT